MTDPALLVAGAGLLAISFILGWARGRATGWRQAMDHINQMANSQRGESP